MRARVFLCTDPETIKAVWTEPRLWDATQDDTDCDREDFEPALDDASIEWLACELAGKVIALLLLRRMNACTWQLHPAFLPEVWGTGITRLCGPLFVKAAFQRTGAAKLVATIPAHYEVVRRFAEHCGFRPEGSSEGAWLKDGRLHDVIYYGLSRELSQKTAAA